MLKRKINTQLEIWKEQDHKSLLLIGPRQCGKTFSVREFARENYESANFIELNFIENLNHKEVFLNSLKVDDIIFNLSLMFPEKKFIPHETLLFFDEIQDCPQAITALKFFTEDKKYDVIASGSMLGLNDIRKSSFPVGYVDHMEMYPLDFEEFLWALNYSDEQLSKIREYFDSTTTVPQSAHNTMMSNFRLYMTLGGMPEVLVDYLDGRDIVKADKRQRIILKDYLYDIAHLAQTREIKIQAERCYMSLPAQLSKNNPKFQYSVVDKDGSARKFGNSITWLENAFLVKPIYSVSKVEESLETYKDTNNFRLYPTDIGMLMAMFEFNIKEKIINDTLTGNTRGAIYEAAMADVLIKNGYDNLYFYKNDNQKAELEFIINNNDGIIPIEVKAGRNCSESLNRFLKKDNISYGYKVINGNCGSVDKKITIPWYMTMFL